MGRCRRGRAKALGDCAREVLAWQLRGKELGEFRSKQTQNQAPPCLPGEPRRGSKLRRGDLPGSGIDPRDARG
eukprot:14978717-Alexandrium_andersonii.AAC.1